ncbi:MAG: beta-galactosidase [Pseudomonadota bacterium]
MSSKATRSHLGVCYYPEHWPEDVWAGDARRMVEVGLTHVRIAEFAWSRIEPRPGEIEFGWLDRAVEALAGAGLKIIMCTPTATPPKWLVDRMPDMLAVAADGAERRFGSRRHYDFSHAGYLEDARRITRAVAERFGQHASVVAWQTDNEYGCHETTVSYSEAARQAFAIWLRDKYGTVDALNAAWGNVFWSMELHDFDAVALPNLTVTEPNPAHVLDFRRFTSDQVVRFNRAQVDIIREFSPGRDITHNFMGAVTDFDHFDVAADLDVASWDSYPLGMLERFGRDEAWRNWYLRAGDPDFQAFHHDLYRGVGGGRMWVMEQQPGPVNWAAWNPAPHPGMVRLWTHEAFAHGAELVSYFRWRQAPFGQEQFHAGLNRPDGSTDVGAEEASVVAGELQAIADAQTVDDATQRSPVAMVVDYPSIWATEIQPQARGYSGLALTFQFYRALRRLGQSIDIVPPGADLTGYAVVVAPHLIMVGEAAAQAFAAADGQIVFGPRAGSRLETHQVPPKLPPGPLSKLLPLRVVRVESLRPGVRVATDDGGAVHHWFEHVEVTGDAKVRAAAHDGKPVWIEADRATYLAGWPDDAWLETVLADRLIAAGLAIVETGDDVRVRDHGALRTIVNYGPREADASRLIAAADEVLIGDADLGVAGVAIVRRAAAAGKAQTS